MSDQDKPDNGNLVPVGRRDLAPIDPVNPLVARGIADLANVRELPNNLETSALNEIPISVQQKLPALMAGLAEHSALAKAHQMMSDLHSQAQKPLLPNERQTSRHPFDPRLRASYSQILHNALRLRLRKLAGTPPKAPNLPESEEQNDLPNPDEQPDRER
jgi:hypothetical protein